MINYRFSFNYTDQFSEDPLKYGIIFNHTAINMNKTIEGLYPSYDIRPSDLVWVFLFKEYKNYYYIKR